MKTIVISLGGSTVVPDQIDVRFLKRFRALILKYIKKDFRFIIVVGGGKTCRKYQKAASQICNLHKEDVDWLGIHATRLNAHLLRTIFRDHAHARVIKNPTSKFNFKKKILIGAGWKPGWSTDYDAVLLAKNFNVKTVVNLTNLAHVYTKDPEKHKDAKPLNKISWQDYRNIVGDKWHPGLNVPFDPVASKVAQKSNIKVYILKGTNLRNLEKLFNKKRNKEKGH